MDNIDEWHRIGNIITKQMGICSCQRKLKSIVTILLRIKNKLARNAWKELTPEELLICNLLESKCSLIDHGVNCEYPLLDNHLFWGWLDDIKDSPNLEDN